MNVNHPLLSHWFLKQWQYLYQEVFAVLYYYDIKRLPKKMFNGLIYIRLCDAEPPSQTKDIGPLKLLWQDNALWLNASEFNLSPFYYQDHQMYCQTERLLKQPIMLSEGFFPESVCIQYEFATDMKKFKNIYIPGKGVPSFHFCVFSDGGSRPEYFSDLEEAIKVAYQNKTFVCMNWIYLSEALMTGSQCCILGYSKEKNKMISQPGFPMFLCDPCSDIWEIIENPQRIIPQKVSEEMVQLMALISDLWEQQEDMMRKRALTHTKTPGRFSEPCYLCVFDPLISYETRNLCSEDLSGTKLTIHKGFLGIKSPYFNLATAEEFCKWLAFGNPDFSLFLYPVAR